MNLRVLVYMNPLVVDKIAKTFVYDKDSGFIFTRNLIAELPENWRYSILVPPSVPRSFFPADRQIELLPYNYSTSIHQNRYHFNRELLAEYFPYGTDVDVILNNQPELTANLDAFFFNQRRERPIILNFFHWIDCKESRAYARDLGGYIWRQIDGVIRGDMNYFHTPYAKSLFDDELARMGVGYHPNFRPNGVQYKADYFNVKPTVFGENPMDLPDKKIILFNHRLNETTGWQEVVKACAVLRTERDDFVLWFTDDQKIDLKETLSNIDFIKVQRVPFESYGYLMHNSHFSVCNLQGYATWNLAVLDSAANYCCPIVRKSPLMFQLFNPLHNLDWAQHCVFNSADELVDKMRAALDRPINDLRYDLRPKPKTDIEDHSIEHTIMRLIDERLESKVPKKYEDVKDYIITCNTKVTNFNAGKVVNFNVPPHPVRKKDWVNHFWSFHANGNFQKIRWRLMSEGIKDDIREKESVYFLQRIW